jgi:hypothetical protein
MVRGDMTRESVLAILNIYMDIAPASMPKVCLHYQQRAANPSSLHMGD